MVYNNNNGQNEPLDTEKEKSERRLDEIERTGSAVTKSSRGALQCLTIIGQIEGHYLLGDNAKTTKYEHIIPMLVGVEESDEIDGLLVILNTVGGDVEAGLAIAELISSMSKPTVSLVLGGGHSIGVPLAVAAKRSFIVPSATMTIHPVRTNGLVVGVPQSFEYLRRMQGRINDFIARNSKVKVEKLNELMMRTDEIATDVGSIIDGDEAVRLGLIDEVGGLDAALKSLHGYMTEGK
ncbi:MAG: peptidase S14 [Clostridiales bacterium]|nr:peptidase S14 [Clostridiales bacterium]